jgi:hypothetical protein
MWIRELATGWERVYKPSEHASASVTRGTRDAVPTDYFPGPRTSTNLREYTRRRNTKLLGYPRTRRYLGNNRTRI